MTNIRERATKLIDRFRDEGYYFPSFMALAVRRGFLPPPNFGEGKTDAEIINFFNDFWFALPDDPSIRVGPFFELCDLCEEIYE